MIFQATHQQVLDGTKTQTRRPLKPGEGWYPWDVAPDESLIYVEDTVGRIKWIVGRDYAVQPGRGKKSIGRIRITKIRRERLRDIKWRDVKAEGVDLSDLTCRGWNRDIDARHLFEPLWKSIYKRKPHRWEDNPEVWVLEFEPVEDFEEFIGRETEAAIEGGIIDENTGLPFELAEQ